MTDLLGPGDAGAALPLAASDPTVIATIAHPDAGDTFFGDCDPANPTTTGTSITAKFLNRVGQQIRRAIRNAGVTLNNSDDDMLWKAIRFGAQAPITIDYVVTTTTLTVPAYARRCRVRAWGAGGGGGGSSGASGGASGGGGGAYADALIGGLTGGASIVAAIGAGGSAGSGAPSSGGAGGSSSFGSYITLTGGGGGYTGNSALQITNAGAGGSASFAGCIAQTSINGGGGQFAWGAAAPTLDAFSPVGGLGGVSPMSGGSAGPNVGGPGSPGVSYGVGGNGGAAGGGGGTGASGLMIVEWFP